MFKKLKKFISKLKIFSRLRYQKAQILELEQILIENEEIFEKMQKQHLNIIKKNNDFMLKRETDIEKLTEKKEKATKFIAIMVGQRNEFLNRILSKMPDHVLSGKMPEAYKLWLMEPFMEKSYTPHKPDDEKSVFVDGYSAIKGLAKVADDFVKDDKKLDDKDVVAKEAETD